MTTYTLYRIYDHTQKETVANGIDSYEFALQTLELYRLELPGHELELEPYVHNTVKPGFGRDPDLHE